MNNNQLSFDLAEPKPQVADLMSLPGTGMTAEQDEDFDRLVEAGIKNPIEARIAVDAVINVVEANKTPAKPSETNQSVKQRPNVTEYQSWDPLN